MTNKIRTGDFVLYHPTGETFLVAYADYQQGIIAWCGWPPGHARISDCELTKSCSDEESRNLLVDLSKMHGSQKDGWDYRKSYAIRALKAMDST